MSTHVSPEWAQKLLQDTTPERWQFRQDVADLPDGTQEIGHIVHADGTPLFECWDGVIDTHPGNLPLAAAAPELAQLVAGMRYEYAVQVSSDGGETWRFAHGATKAIFDPIKPCWWFRTEEEAQDFAKFRTTKRSSARVVRRLVTDVEVVE